MDFEDLVKMKIKICTILMIYVYLIIINQLIKALNTLEKFIDFIKI